MSKTTNILIVGVGGQGTILSSRIIAKVVIGAGFDVKVSEIHGMSQRGGSVVTQVRFGEKVASPIISPGTVDIIIAFEKLEALRWLGWLAPDGVIIVNTQEIYPMPVITGVAEYPADITETITKEAPQAYFLDALDLAVKSGNAKSANVVLLGKLSTLLDIPQESWTEAIKTTVHARFVDVNLAAFAAGVSG